MKKAVRALFFATVFAINGFSQDTAYVPVLVNVNANVKMQQSDGTGQERNVMANKLDTLKLILNGNEITSLFHGQQAYTQAAVAEYSLFSLNGKHINTSQSNIAKGIYLLSAKKADGSKFTTKIAHLGGNLSKNMRKAGDYGVWEITVHATGYIDSSYYFELDKGMNPLQNITLHSELTPSFGTNVSVHDPSIFAVNDGSATDRFRVIGSHLASAKSGNLLTWTSVQSDRNTSNFSAAIYYPKDNPDANVQNMSAQIADVMRASPNDGLSFFASDIHKMPNGKFYHYYSLTSTWKCSAIGLAIASTVEGDYITQGLFVRSAEAGENKTPDGTRDWAINAHPNCIDPQAFFDKENENFYMVYGSWSGGIFIFEMDVNTGLPKTGSAMNAENGGYGRRLIANNHSGIEGPYILYSPESDYYYLFVSFGGLASDGGYNMRVFRSRYPYGPYEDAVHSTIVLNTGTYLNYGVKIMGGYQFAQLAGEKALNSNIGVNGFLSPGHNSAWYDAALGKHYLIHHTRFVGRGEIHYVRVREMFVNENGWLVAAPFRYDGGTVRTFSKAQLSGTWKILSHGRDNNTTVAEHTSMEYVFNDDGSISGAGTGIWKLGSDRKTAYITIDSVLYKGVFLRSYDEFHAAWVNAFTALSLQGIAIWGASKAE